MKNKMKKEKPCLYCNGTGEIQVEFCDICGKEANCGNYEGKRICQQCWAATLTDNEINNLL